VGLAVWRGFGLASVAAATIALATVAGASPSLIASAITRSTVKGSEQALGVMAGRTRG